MALNKNILTEKIIKIIIISSGVFQLISLLRAAAIYNTAYIVIGFNLLLSSLVTILILFSLKNLRFNLITGFLFISTVISIFFGLYYNHFSRYFFSDSYNMIFFILFILFIGSIKSLDFELSRVIKFSAILFYISILLTFLLPLVGVPILSVGKASIAMTLPFFYFLFKGNKGWAITTFVFLILASKRGIILSLVLALLSYIIFVNKLSLKIKTISLTFLIGIIVSGVYYSIDPQVVYSLPKTIQPLFYKLMLINPFSSYNQINNDYRVFEALSSIKDMLHNPLLFFSGYGSGYTYNVGDQFNETITTDIHNTHFTPFSLLIKGGIFYTIAIYILIFISIVKGFRQINNLNVIQKTFLLYLIASLFNSFTAFTIYIDYLFIYAIGTLFSIKNKRNEVKL